MSAYSGPQGPVSKNGRRNKGVAEERKQQKRAEAEARAAGKSQEQVEELEAELLTPADDKDKKDHKK
jgi:hypothetical protein